MFVLHVIGLGILLGRFWESFPQRRLARAFIYLLAFYLFWGLVFASFPDLIRPAL